ncbi:CMD domain protein [Arthrobacter sp. GMC3]|uniref:CMD domain protein n=1 Tax=Arthrobacter sp. GMC3 TaxID=2058894 RepID=UPI000CE374AE|nr:CMD domain protein [Arthrobacter sp. GMC3]
MTSTISVTDAVDTILGTSPGSALDLLRRRRPVTRENTQASYLALFHADELDDASLSERFAVATFVASLHSHVEAAEFYGEGLNGNDSDRNLRVAVLESAVSGAAQGPYGDYREIGLRSENQPGLRWQIPEAISGALGTRLSAALEHAHLLVFRPRESSPAALHSLVEAGWSTTGIVTLSQLVAFLAYQLRVISGLQVLDIALQGTLASTPTTIPSKDQTVRIGS